MSQNKNEAINNDELSKLGHHLVSMLIHICKFVAIEVEQWLNQKPCSSSTNTENVAAQSGGGGYSKTPSSKAMLVDAVDQHCHRSGR